MIKLRSKLSSIKSIVRTTLDFAKNDFKRRYAGSYLGIIWAYIQTLVMVAIYWVVFQFGLRVGGAGDVPFILWFISALMPWLFFSEIITSTIPCMSEYSYIVKKVMFNVNILPAMKIVVCCFIYTFFLAVVLAVAFLSGFFSGWYLIQLIYYLVCLVALAIPLTYLCCTVSVFFKDFSQIITIVLNMLMWGTPIVWSYTIVPESFQWILKLNPMFYVTEGFRESIIYKIGFWNHPVQTIGFWLITVVLWFVCIRIYKRLVPHLADVL